MLPKLTENWRSKDKGHRYLIVVIFQAADGHSEELQHQHSQRLVYCGPHLSQASSHSVQGQPEGQDQATGGPGAGQQVGVRAKLQARLCIILVLVQCSVFTPIH